MVVLSFESSLSPCTELFAPIFHSFEAGIANANSSFFEKSRSVIELYTFL